MYGMIQRGNERWGKHKNNITTGDYKKFRQGVVLFGCVWDTFFVCTAVSRRQFEGRAAVAEKSTNSSKHAPGQRRREGYLG
jgi:hypothetical protein